MPKSTNLKTTIILIVTLYTLNTCPLLIGGARKTSKMLYNGQVANGWQSCKSFARNTLQTTAKGGFLTFAMLRSGVRLPFAPMAFEPKNTSVCDNCMNLKFGYCACRKPIQYGFSPKEVQTMPRLNNRPPKYCKMNGQAVVYIRASH